MKRTPLHFSVCTDSKRHFLVSAQIKLRNDFVDSLFLSKKSCRKSSKFRQKNKRFHTIRYVGKTMGKKWPNFCVSTNPPDNNLKQIGALFFLLKLYIIKLLWNATHMIFLELLGFWLQKNVQFVCTANNYITQLTLLNKTIRSIPLSISTSFLKYLVRQTGFFVYFELDFCRLHSLVRNRQKNPVRRTGFFKLESSKIK